MGYVGFADVDWPCRQFSRNSVRVVRQYISHHIVLEILSAITVIIATSFVPILATPVRRTGSSTNWDLH